LWYSQPTICNSGKVETEFQRWAISYTRSDYPPWCVTLEERRGSLTLVLGLKEGRLVMRRTEGIREWQKGLQRLSGGRMERTEGFWAKLESGDKGESREEGEDSGLDSLHTSSSKSSLRITSRLQGGSKHFTTPFRRVSPPTQLTNPSHKSQLSRAINYSRPPKGQTRRDYTKFWTRLPLSPRRRHRD